MKKILTWNVQNGIDAYGYDKRAEQHAYLQSSNADLIALQEVDKDYFWHLQNQLKDFYCFYAPAYTRVVDGEIKQFGNLIATRLDTTYFNVHPLAFRPQKAVKYMPRNAAEILVWIDDQPLQLITTHLEFHDAAIRKHQLNGLFHIIEQSKAYVQTPSIAVEGDYVNQYFHADALFCGDFNIPTQSEEYQQEIKQSPRWEDIGNRLLSEEHFTPTCGIFDHKQWESGADCRDYFLYAGDLNHFQFKPWVDTDTDLSDHQPVFLELMLKI